MRILDTFSGIAGFTYAAQQVWPDLEIHGFIEKDSFCQKVIAKHYPGIPIHDDIRTYKHDGTTINLLTGGFPCQPFSCAGKRGGTDDDRYLWPELLRVIQECQPEWCILENVPGLLSIDGGVVIDQVLDELEDAGYWAQTFKIGAFAADAPHKRDRLWFVANSTRIGRRGRRDGDEGGLRLPLQTEGSCSSEKCKIFADTKKQDDGQGKARTHQRQEFESGNSGFQNNVSNPKASVRRWSDGQEHTGGRDSETGRQGESIRGIQYRGAKSRMGGMVDGFSLWMDEPDIPRVAAGVPDRINRLKGLGNAVVPWVAVRIMEAIRDI